MSAHAQGTPLRLLLLEDSEEDAELVVDQLQRRARFDPIWQRVESPEDLEHALDTLEWDVVVADGSLPRLPSLAALDVVRGRGLDLPFIILSGTIDGQAAEAARRAGVDDCISKQELGALVEAVERSLRKCHARRTRLRNERESSGARLRRALETQYARDADAETGPRAPHLEVKTRPGAMPAASAYDALTGLPGRALFGDRLAQSLAQAERTGRGLAVAFLDLDHFKRVNDTLGHGAGDALLRAASERLQAGLRREDTVARWGGDEFVMLLPGIAAAEDAARVALKLLDVLREPLRCNGHQVQVTASIGISLFPGDARDPAALIDRADAALYRAKEGGRNCYRLFTPAMQARAFERLALEQGLQAALDRSELTLRYQPIVALENGAVTGVEALLRWRHPELGVVPPSRFLSVLEQTGWIVTVGEWVLRTACTEAAPWLRRPGLRLAVNVSARELRDEGFVARLRTILAETGMNPSCLELDLSEPALPEGEDVVRAVRRLKELGVRIALDDMGAGPCALGVFRRLPVDTLKVDCAGLREGKDGPQLVKALIDLGRNLGLRVVAEGVETERHLAFLRAQRCHEVQGFVASRDLPAAVVDGLLGERSPLLPPVPPARA
jgi:diguanylate cyclase (GGDEF)-like protein